MNVLTPADLNDAGAPLLRTGADNENDEEFLMATFSNVEIHVAARDDNDDDENECMTEELPMNATHGTLHVTTKRIVWVGDRAAPRVGYGWDVNQITLHAISRDPAAFPRPCLYCQMGTEDITEVRFVPADDAQLAELFTAFSKSAEMNPDEDESGEEGGEDGDGWIYDEEEVESGARAAQIAAHLDAMLHISPGLERSNDTPVAGQFDDADEDDDDDLL